MHSSADAPPADQLSCAHPVVREWFTSRFGTPTEPQALLHKIVGIGSQSHRNQQASRETVTCNKARYNFGTNEGEKKWSCHP